MKRCGHSKSYHVNRSAPLQIPGVMSKISRAKYRNAIKTSMQREAKEQSPVLMLSQSASVASQP